MEGAPIVVALAPIDVRNPKKAPQPYRNKGDIVPDTKPPSTEKRGVKGRPGQRPMPTSEGVAVEPDQTGYQKDLLTTPKNTLVVDTPGDLDWYKLGQHYPTLDTDDPHEYGQGDSDMVIVPYSKQELVDLKSKLDRLKMKYKDIGGGHEQPEIHDKVEEKMLPKSVFAGTKVGQKVGSAGQWKNTGPNKNRPVRAGDLVGGAAQESAGSGVIASKKQANDPRYSMSLTRDVRPGQIAKNLKAFSLEEDVETAMATAISKLIESQFK